MSSPAQRSSPTAGLTLIEVLVAVTLLALLAGALTLALQTAAASWKQGRQRLTLDRRTAVSNQILHAALANLAPVIALPPPGHGPAAPFFHGEPNEMRFVSGYSSSDGRRGGLEIVELAVIEGPNGLRLTMTESPYRGPASVGRFVVGMIPPADGLEERVDFLPVQPRPDSLIAADRLSRCTFSYLKRPRQPNAPAVWQPVWDGLVELPAAVRIAMEPAPDDEKRLRPVTVTAQLRVQPPPPNEAHLIMLQRLLQPGSAR